MQEGTFIPCVYTKGCIKKRINLVLFRSPLLTSRKFHVIFVAFISLDKDSSQDSSSAVPLAPVTRQTPARPTTAAHHHPTPTYRGQGFFLLWLMACSCGLIPPVAVAQLCGRVVASCNHHKSYYTTTTQAPQAQVSLVSSQSSISLSAPPSGLFADKASPSYYLFQPLFRNLHQKTQLTFSFFIFTKQHNFTLNVKERYR